MCSFISIILLIFQTTMKPQSTHGLALTKTSSQLILAASFLFGSRHVLTLFYSPEVFLRLSSLFAACNSDLLNATTKRTESCIVLNTQKKENQDIIFRRKIKEKLCKFLQSLEMILIKKKLHCLNIEQRHENLLPALERPTL